MSTSTAVEVLLAESVDQREVLAVAGFLAGYGGTTRISYASDLRSFRSWCHEAKLTLFTVRGAHLELFGRSMEETGRMRSTVARPLSTLASFYKYCEQEQLVERNPALNVRRPKVDYESRTLGLDRAELGAFLVQAGRGSARDLPWPRSWPSTAYGFPKPWAPMWMTSISSGGTARSRFGARAASV